MLLCLVYRLPPGQLAVAWGLHGDNDWIALSSGTLMGTAARNLATVPIPAHTMTLLANCAQQCLLPAFEGS